MEVVAKEETEDTILLMETEEKTQEVSEEIGDLATVITGIMAIDAIPEQIGKAAETGK